MKMIRFRKPLIAVACFILLGLWLSLTNPQNMPVVFLMVPFALLFAGLWLSVTVIITKFFPKMERSRRIATATCISGVPVFLLLLGSVNQLTWRDVILVFVFVGFLYFYSGRLHFSER